MMVKMSAFHADTVMQTLLPLADCSVNDRLNQAAPIVKQPFFQMVDVTNLAAVHSLLQNAPDHVVNRIEIRAV